MLAPVSPRRWRPPARAWWRQPWTSPVDDAAQLAQREFGRCHRAVRQLGRDPLEDVRVGQSAGLQLAVASPDELLRRLVEVRQYVQHHPGRLAAAERRAADQMVDEVIVGHTAIEHPLILRFLGAFRKIPARYRAGLGLNGEKTDGARPV